MRLCRNIAPPSPIPIGNDILEIEFDFIGHRLVARTSRGDEATIPLEPQTVADFYFRVIALLNRLGVTVAILTVMITPIMIALTCDALASVPVSWKEGAVALGLHPLRALRAVTLRAIRPNATRRWARRLKSAKLGLKRPD